MKHVISFPELTTKELDSYSLARGFGAFMDKQGGPSFETELSASVEEVLPSQKRHGLWCPTEIVLRQLLASTAGGGKELVPTPHGQPYPWIDARRPRSILVALGADVVTDVPLPALVPRVATGATGQWVVEGAAVDDEEGYEYEMIELEAHLLMANVAASRQLWHQGSLERFLRADLALAFERAWDCAGIAGTGLNGEPTGLLQNTDIQTVTATGVPSWENLLEMERVVADADAEGGRLGYAASPQLREVLKNTEKTTGNGGFIWEGSSVNGYPAAASSAVPGNDNASPPIGHQLIYGAWDSLIIALSPYFQVVIDPFSRKREGIVEFTPFLPLDIQVRHPEAFVKLTGATTGG